MKKADKDNYPHGFKKYTKEYDKMVACCRKYNISRQEYCENIGTNKYRMDRRKEHLNYQKNSKEYYKSKSLKQLYGILLDDYNKLFEKQNGCCAICNKHQTEFEKALAVDHCHETGKVRGLLCNNCNNGLGRFKDNFDILLSAAEYLKNTK